MSTLALFLGIVFLLFMSCFFSASETAFLALGRADVKRMSRGGHPERLVFRLLRQPQRLLSTILVGNMFVNVLMAALFSLLLQRGLLAPGRLEGVLSGCLPGVSEAGLAQAGKVIRSLLNIAIVTPLLMIFGEQTPKVVAYSNAVGFSRHSAPLLSSFEVIFTPFSWLLRVSCDIVLRIIGQKPVGPWKEITTEELLSSLSVSQKSGATSDNEYNMLARLVELSSIDVKEIMTHRMEVVGISDAVSLREAFAFAKSKRHSWFPVYSGNVDGIWGMLSLVDILNWRGHSELEMPLSSFREAVESGRKGLPVTPAVYVPATLSIDKLLLSMRKNGFGFAVVVDEYGGTAGIATITDIIEEFVGRFASGEEDEDALHYRKDGTIICDGRAHLRVLQKTLGKAFDLEECVADTIGGLIMEQTRVIPHLGTSMTLKDGTTIVVRRMSGRRVRTVEIIPQEEQPSGQPHSRKEEMEDKEREVAP